MITDDDLTPIDLSDFWDYEDKSDAVIQPDYIETQISRIPQYGDDSRWRLASYLNMFSDLNCDGSLTSEQREAIDNFVLGYQYQKSSQREALVK